MSDENNLYDREIMMKLLEGLARLDSRLDSLEGIIRDDRDSARAVARQAAEMDKNKVSIDDHKELISRVSHLEAHKNKTLGMAFVIAFTVPIIVRILMALGSGDPTAATSS